MLLFDSNCVMDTYMYHWYCTFHGRILLAKRVILIDVDTWYCSSMVGCDQILVLDFYMSYSHLRMLLYEVLYMIGLFTLLYTLSLDVGYIMMLILLFLPMLELTHMDDRLYSYSEGLILPWVVILFVLFLGEHLL